MANSVKPVNTERTMSKAPGGSDPQAAPPHSATATDNIDAVLTEGDRHGIPRLL
jgi:hypothetical protein